MYRLQITLLGLLVLLVAGCSSASSPQLIAAYPSTGQTESHPYVPPSPAQFVYDAYIELEVSNTASASREAQDLAYDYAGYLVSSQSWRQDGQKHITLVLAVPVANFDGLRAAITRLGTLQSERVSGEWVSTGYGSEWTVYSEITVQLHPKSLSWPRLGTSGWDPSRTLEHAWGVFITIFGFLVDILIWVAVVLGPFALLGWFALALSRRVRGRTE